MLGIDKIVVPTARSDAHLRQEVARLDRLRSGLANGNIQVYLASSRYPGPAGPFTILAIDDPDHSDAGADDDALRHAWLRLIDGIRSPLRLMLIRVLGALSCRPEALNFLLQLLAAVRCF